MPTLWLGGGHFFLHILIIRMIGAILFLTLTTVSRQQLHMQAVAAAGEVVFLQPTGFVKIAAVAGSSSQQAMHDVY